MVMIHQRWLHLSVLMFAATTVVAQDIEGEMIVSAEPVYQSALTALRYQEDTKNMPQHVHHARPKRTHLPQHPQSPFVAAWAQGMPAQDAIIPEDVAFMRNYEDVRGPSYEDQNIIFNGATLAETGFAFPPDTMGDVSENQVIVAVRGLLRSFNKAGQPDGALEISLDAFFAPVTGGYSVIFPQIRFDSLSQRWFLTACTSETPENRILVAVSPSAVVTPTSQWLLFEFPQSQVNPSGQVGLFADYPTLGVDVNALYIGMDMYDVFGAYITSNMMVVNKASLLSGGAAVATMFRSLGGNIYAPQGANNPDAGATQGFFVGVNGSVLGELVLFQVNNPGGVPTLTGPASLVVPATAQPLRVPHLRNTNGFNGQLDAIDDHLTCAHIRDGYLWTVHNIGVDNTGVAGVVTRDGCRWYQIDLVGPSLTQAGTLFAASTANTTDQLFYWMPSLYTNSLGMMMLGCSVAGERGYVNAAFARRFATDSAGSLRYPVQLTNTVYAYNPVGDQGSILQARRWGYYSKTMVDPVDDMSMWTFQEYCNVTNSYAVRVAKILAPEPTVVGIAPNSAAQGNASVPVVITGTGFYSTGFAAGSVSVMVVNTNGIQLTVNSVTPVSDSVINATISTVGAPVGFYNVVVTNPDGQSSILVNGFQVL